MHIRHEDWRIDFLPLYGQFQFSMPSSSMVISFLGSIAVKKVIGVVSFDFSYPTLNSFQISMNNLPNTWTGSMTITVMLV